MTRESLSAEALTVINNYLHLPFPGRDISCSYYNNDRQRVRAALRVLVGKGTPEEITEEARLIGLRDKIKLNALDDLGLKKFLAQNNLGVDCSGFVFHVLDAECRARGLGPLARRLRYPPGRNLWRRLLSRLRPAENTDVLTLANEANSSEVNATEARPGDFIALIKKGGMPGENHILLAHEVKKENESTIIHYTHSFQWTKEGRYEHGVRQGKIELPDGSASLLYGSWTEKEKTGAENETFSHARLSGRLEIRRLNFFES